MIQNLKTTEAEDEKLTKEVFLVTDEKAHRKNLNKFLKNYVRYLNKLLLCQKDPFLQLMRQKHQRNLDFDKLSKVSTVFHRLSY